jgi:hypothetical protein
MSTQGGSTNWTISNFYVVETDPAALTPSEILPLNTAFELKVEFNGSGGGWNALEILGGVYTVDFYAEGIGLNAPEIDLGQVNGNLGPVGGGPYTATLNVTSGLTVEGIYRLGCIIKIVPDSGIVGFQEDLLITIAKNA